jgi:hypothetical protein
MGLGRDMIEEAMIDQMIAEDLASEKERAVLFDAMGGFIRQAKTHKDLQDALLMILNLIRENI